MGPSIRYINQSAPFWDFVANLESQGGEHPLFSGPSGNSGNESEGQRSYHPWGPWGGWNRGWQHGQELPHRGPPTGQEGEGDEQVNQDTNEKEKKVEGEEKETGSAAEDNPNQPDEGCRRKHGGCRRGGRGGPGAGYGRHGPHGAFGPHGHHGGPRRGRPGFFPMHGHPAFEFISGMFQDKEGVEAQDFKPEADVFDTESSYIIHLSLPGAKKEDIGVSWDAEKSELGISGVVHRPGDEELLKTLALDERKVGAFERKVRLGTRAIPAQVDVEGISAKLENGILIIEVPKIGGEGFVEVKKVDIE